MVKGIAEDASGHGYHPDVKDFPRVHDDETGCIAAAAAWIMHEIR